MCTFNGKVVDDSIYINNHQVQNGQESALATDLFYHICRFTGDDIFTKHRNCEVITYYPKIGGDDI